MTPNIIYVKTPAGEAAIRQRTRLMPRNVRLLLILVDGQTSCADLCLKMGDAALVEKALHELEQGGFIAPRNEQDSIWDESQKVAQEIREAAIKKAIQLSVQDGTTPVAPISSLEEATPAAPFSLSPEPTTPAGANRSRREESKAHPLPSSTSPPEQSWTPWLSLARKKKVEKPSEKNASKRRNEPEKAMPLKIGRKDQRSPLNLPRKALLTLLACAILGYLAVILFPCDSFLPEIETALTRQTGHPAKIGSLRLEAFPHPSISLREVRLSDASGDLFIPEIGLQPSLRALFSASADKIHFQTVTLKAITLPAERLDLLCATLQAIGKGKNGILAERIRVEKLRLVWEELPFPEMDGDIGISVKESLPLLRLHTADRTLTLEITPSDQVTGFLLEAKSWRPASDAPLVIDAATLEGRLENGALNVKKMEVHLLDGLLRGEFLARVQEKREIRGSLRFERINTSRLGALMEMGEQFSGNMAGKIQFSAKADTWSEILAATEAEGEFSLGRGKVHGVDLAEVARRMEGTPVRGGTTSFEKLAGKIRLTASGKQFTQLILSSGLMQASGNIDIDAKRTIRGRMELQMHGTANQTRVPIMLGGTLKEPSAQIAKR